MKLNYEFQKPELLEQALTHKSFHFENLKASPGHNERLEFLGDAVLDLVLSFELMKTFPAESEGSLSKKRASLVNEAVLSRIGAQLEVNSHMKLGRGEVLTGGGLKPRLLASAFEAIVGAVFLDSNFEKVQIFVQEHFKEVISEMSHGEDYLADYKSRFQEWAQAYKKATPIYEVLKEEGPSHDRTFEVCMKINGQVISHGQGRSKKQAEQEAAREALSQVEAEKL